MVMDSRYPDFSDVLNGFEFDDGVVLPGFDSAPDVGNGFKFGDEIVLPGFDSAPDVGNGFKFGDEIVLPGFDSAPDFGNGFNFSDEVVLPGFDSTQNVANGFKFRDDLDFSFLDIPNHPTESDYATTISPTGSSELYSPDDNEFSDGVLKFLNQILMEEKIDEKPSMFHDPLALQASEKSFSEVVGKNYPLSPDGPVDVYQGVESPNDYFARSPSEHSTSSGGTSCGNYYEPPQSVADSVGPNSSNVQIQHQEDFSSSNSGSRSQWSVMPENSFRNNINGVMYSPVSTQVVPNMNSESETILQFKRGMEEANKFLPNIAQFLVSSNNYALPTNTKQGPPAVQVKIEKDEETSPGSSRRRKHYLRQDSVIEDERSSKHSAVYEEEVELLEMFDKVLLFEPGCDKEEPIERSPASHLENGLSHGSSGSWSHSTITESGSEAVDLRTLLINCAQSVASEDRKTAYEQLKMIRQHSSALGDASQRLAFIFANGLEARMAGTGTQLYAALASRRKISATEKLKAYQAYLSACPFKKTSVLFSNKMILEKASNATTLHIIDFGIQYGFQWPVLIQLLSKRPGGPPKLRITGIELPQPGFRPAEYMEATGRRLRSYCERFKVPFEYNPIASQKWETITVEDLKAVINGAYGASFFVTRFREALYHYSSFLDLLDTTIPSDNQQRLNFEREFCGREVMNVIACEGMERVERPETYKQWHVRNTKAGFKLHPLNKELVKKLKHKVKLDFHKDFVFNEDCEWILVGWKGRILHAVSAWVPA
ncbi:Scarecrow-like protein 14 [Heracleum sosnowskyi]|uniref:Scarecrow-like protein 14 n=1 Tax=Heracleum sosnowskyi TaxID=360622 RepID=A0AAD8N6R2_9APIA|nr:Scarecrow-like protein 14 [Heracleum sosnowskyi]